MCSNPGATQYSHVKQFRFASEINEKFARSTEQEFCQRCSPFSWPLWDVWVAVELCVNDCIHFILVFLIDSSHSIMCTRKFMQFSHARCTLNRLMVCRTSYIFFVFPILDTTEFYSVSSFILFFAFLLAEQKGEIFLFIYHSERGMRSRYARIRLFFVRSLVRTIQQMSQMTAHAAIYFYTVCENVRTTHSRKTSRCIGTCPMPHCPCLHRCVVFIFISSSIRVR